MTNSFKICFPGQGRDRNINKDWNIFLKVLGKDTPLVFSRIILGSKSEKFKRIEASAKS